MPIDVRRDDIQIALNELKAKENIFVLMEKMGGAFTKQEAKNQSALKKVIEENTTDYYPVVVGEVEELISEVEVAE